MVADQIFYTIRDVKHGLFLNSGVVADNQVYHQTRHDASCSEWCIVPAPTSLMDDPSRNYYFIRDKKHNLCLTAGKIMDGHVYHQPQSNLKNAMWSITPTINGNNGFGGFTITDALHGRCLSAGCVHDNNIYHQEVKTIQPLEQLWHIECVTLDIQPADYPDFFIKPGSFRVKNLEIQNFLERATIPASIVLAGFNNKLSTAQHMHMSKSTSVATAQSLTTQNTCSDELSSTINAQIKANFFGGGISAGVSVSTTSRHEHSESATHTFMEENKFTIEQDIEVPPKANIQASLEYSNEKATLNYTATVEYVLFTPGSQAKTVERTVSGTWNGTTLISYDVTLGEKGVNEA